MPEGLGQWAPGLTWVPSAERRETESRGCREGGGEGEERGPRQAGSWLLQEAPRQLEPWHLVQKLTQKRGLHSTAFLKLPCWMTAIFSSLLPVQSTERLRYLTLLQLSPQQKPKEAPVRPTMPSALPRCSDTISPGLRLPWPEGEEEGWTARWGRMGPELVRRS